MTLFINNLIGKPPEWISINDRPPEGECLVFLEKNMLGMRIHTANFEKNVQLIGGRFEFDAPKITHWMPLPVPPNIALEQEKG